MKITLSARAAIGFAVRKLIGSDLSKTLLKGKSFIRRHKSTNHARRYNGACRLRLTRSRSTFKYKIPAFVILAFLICFVLPNTVRSEPPDETSVINAVKKAIPDFSPLEEDFFRKTFAGELLSKETDGAAGDDPNDATRWNGRKIRAICIEYLYFNSNARVLVTSRGIRLCGICIEGDLLNLAHSHAEFPFMAWKCRFECAFDASSSHIGSLRLLDSFVPTLIAEGAQIDGSVDIAYGFKSKTGVNFEGISISGDLNCQGMQIELSPMDHSPKKGAINATHASIGGMVSLSVADPYRSHPVSADPRYAFKAPGTLRFQGATIARDFDCTGAFLNATHLPTPGEERAPDHFALVGDGAAIGGALILRNVDARGSVSFNSAKIGTIIDSQHAKFYAPSDAKSPIALNLKSVLVGRGVVATEIQVEGQIDLSHSKIDGDFNCQGAKFNLPGKTAIEARRAQIGGDFSIAMTTIDGEFSASDAVIDGGLQCNGATLANALGKAVCMNRAHIAKDVLLNPATVFGIMDFTDAAIDGSLRCDGATLTNPNGDVLEIIRAHIGHDVMLPEDLKVQGNLDLSHATVDNVLKISYQNKHGSELRLVSTKARVFDDDELRDKNTLRVIAIKSEGFVYEHFEDPRRHGFEYFTDWAALNDHFSPQQYEQAAKVLKETVSSEIARDVLIEENKHFPGETMHITNSVAAFFWHHFAGPAIGYGYKPYLALFWSIPFVLFGWALFFFGYTRFKAFLPTNAEFVAKFTEQFEREKKEADLKKAAKGYARAVKVRDAYLAAPPGSMNSEGAIVDDEQKTALTAAEERAKQEHGRLKAEVAALPAVSPELDNYPKFRSFIFAIETFVPILKLYMIDSWQPNEERGTPLFNSRFKTGGLIRCYLWLHIAAGWVLTTLWVAGLAGIIKGY